MSAYPGWLVCLMGLCGRAEEGASGAVSPRISARRGGRLGRRHEGGRKEQALLESDQN